MPCLNLPIRRSRLVLVPLLFLQFTLTLAILTGCGESPPLPATPDAEDQATATVEAAIDRFRVGDPAGAAEILAQVAATDPEDDRTWAMLGQARHQAGDHEQALDAYERALELNPERHGARYGAAALSARLGQVEKALEQLRRLEDSKAFDLSQIALDPDLESLRDQPGYEDLLMKPEDFEDPFVESTRVLHEWVGEAPGDEFGWIARNLGDVDGDGIADVTTSAPSKNLGGANAGRVYTYSGKSGELLWTQSGEPGQKLGMGIEAAGDVNADGVPDVVAGAPLADLTFVYSGRDGEILLELAGSQKGENFGRKVSDVGDVNGDGHDDVLVGAPRNDAEGEDAGRTGLYSGKDGSLLKEWFGERAGDRQGSSGAGLVREGQFFVVIGAPDAGEGQRGRVYVHTDLGDEPTFVLDSDEQGSELGGMFVSVVGDVDADGTLDVYAADWGHGALGPQTGRIVVHSGKDGRNLLTLTGEAAGNGFGIGPADAGDVNGDGHDDLVVGAWQQGHAAPAGGKVYVYSGKDGTLLRTWTCRVMGDTFGFDATGMGDVDGDGHIDFLLTSAWSGIRGAKSGRMFLLAGGP